jgi:hypothetical protein
MSVPQELAPVLTISQGVIDDTFAAVHSTPIDEFRRAEYQRLADAGDPTEHMLMSAFGILIAGAGEKVATSFLVGGFIVTHSLYAEAEQKAMVLRRPDTAMVAPQVDAIARAFNPSKQFDVSDMYDEFPTQPALCAAINGLKSPATRVGALTVMGVYAHHLIEPGHKMTIRIGDLPIPGTADATSQVTVSPAE